MQGCFTRVGNNKKYSSINGHNMGPLKYYTFMSRKKSPEINLCFSFSSIFRSKVNLQLEGTFALLAAA